MIGLVPPLVSPPGGECPQGEGGRAFLLTLIPVWKIASACVAGIAHARSQMESHMNRICPSMVVVLLAAFALFTAARPARAQAADIDIPFQKFVLDNGLTVIIHEDHKAPIVAVNVWYHVGSKNEDRKSVV